MSTGLPGRVNGHFGSVLTGGQYDVDVGYQCVQHVNLNRYALGILMEVVKPLWKGNDSFA